MELVLGPFLGVLPNPGKRRNIGENNLLPCSNEKKTMSQTKEVENLPGLLLLLSLLGIPVEEEIGHDIPGQLPADGSPQPEHLPGQEPEHEADGVGALVVAGDGNIDVLRGAVTKKAKNRTL